MHSQKGDDVHLISNNVDVSLDFLAKLRQLIHFVFRYQRLPSFSRLLDLDNAACRNSIVIVITKFFQVHVSVFDVMPVAQEEEVIQMSPHPCLAAALCAQYRCEKERFRGGMHSGAGEDALCAEELERLDLDSVRCEVEIAREDNVGYMHGRRALSRIRLAIRRSRRKVRVVTVRERCRWRGGRGDEEAVGESFKGGRRGTVDNSAGKAKRLSGYLVFSLARAIRSIIGARTSCNSSTRSSRPAGGVLMRQCSRAIKLNSAASSRSLRSWTLSMRLSSAIVSARGRQAVHWLPCFCSKPNSR